MDLTRTLIAQLPLKALDATLLRTAILSEAGLGGTDLRRMESALDFAAYAHRDDTRQTRGNMPRAPYIEHPLRGALRLVRYGVTNADVLIATVLHDTIEDHASDIALSYLNLITSERDARLAVQQLLVDEYGADVARLVFAVSNPLADRWLTRAEKNQMYVAHVLAVTAAPDVFLVKFTDFVDNALSLHHTLDTNQAMVQRLATKYLPLLPAFSARLSEPDLAPLVPQSGLGDMRAHLAGGRLAEFAAGASPA